MPRSYLDDNGKVLYQGDMSNGWEKNWTSNTDFDAIYNPITSFNFVLEVELLYYLPIRTVRAFTKENEYEYIREGGVNDYVHMKRKQISKPFTFQIERYVGTERFIDPLANGTELALPLFLYVYRHKTRQGLFTEGAPAWPARVYVFTGCTVMSKEYGELNAEKSGIVTEITTIAYRELMVVNNPFQSGSQDDEWTSKKEDFTPKVKRARQAFNDRDKNSIVYKREGTKVTRTDQAAKDKAAREYKGDMKLDDKYVRIADKDKATLFDYDVKITETEKNNYKADITRKKGSSPLTRGKRDYKGDMSADEKFVKVADKDKKDAFDYTVKIKETEKNNFRADVDRNVPKEKDADKSLSRKMRKPYSKDMKNDPDYARVSEYDKDNPPGGKTYEVTFDDKMEHVKRTDKGDFNRTRTDKYTDNIGIDEKYSKKAENDKLDKSIYKVESTEKGRKVTRDDTANVNRGKRDYSKTNEEDKQEKYSRIAPMDKDGKSYSSTDRNGARVVEKRTDEDKQLNRAKRDYELKMAVDTNYARKSEIDKDDDIYTTSVEGKAIKVSRDDKADVNRGMRKYDKTMTEDATEKYSRIASMDKESKKPYSSATKNGVRVVEKRTDDGALNREKRPFTQYLEVNEEYANKSEIDKTEDIYKVIYEGDARNVKRNDKSKVNRGMRDFNMTIKEDETGNYSRVSPYDKGSEKPYASKVKNGMNLTDKRTGESDLNRERREFTKDLKVDTKYARKAPNDDVRAPSVTWPPTRRAKMAEALSKK